MAKPTTICVRLLLTLFVCTPVLAQMYRWVDENDVTVYSQTPPPSGAAVKLKPQAEPSPEETAAAREHLQRQIEQSADEREAREQKAQEKANQKEAAQKRAENCIAARRNLETLENLGRRMLRTADGQYLRPTEDQVEMYKRKAQDQIDDHCK
ncbi:MAG: DUF4124 domain-containing protein [Pseudomonadota bacterium]|nr:DUF4124 domain-containing protein [Pseudomonadota bacterium]